MKPPYPYWAWGSIGRGREQKNSGARRGPFPFLCEGAGEEGRRVHALELGGEEVCGLACCGAVRAAVTGARAECARRCCSPEG